MSTKTKDGIEVKVGQVWGIRQRRYHRIAEIIGVYDDHVLMLPEDGLASRVSYAGLKERWKLIKDV